MSLALDPRSRVDEGFPVPNWSSVKSFALHIQDSLRFCRKLGLDIAFARDGEPVRIEINATPHIGAMVTGPLLGDEKLLWAFGEWDILISRPQRPLYRQSCEREGRPL